MVKGGKMLKGSRIVAVNSGSCVCHSEIVFGFFVIAVHFFN